MRDAEKAAIIATLAATQEVLERVTAELLRINGPHQVIRATYDGSNYFSVQSASELFEMAERLENAVRVRVSAVEG